MTQRNRCGSANEGFARKLKLPMFQRRLAAPTMLALAAAVPSAAFAASGETTNTVGTFRATSAVCQQLRQKSGVPTGAFTFACNANRSTAGGREACDIVSLSTLVRGSALGFCADELPSVRPVVFPGTGPLPVLETAKTLRATTFGVNTGVTRNDGTIVDVVCSTFAPASGTVGKNAAQGVRACRQVLSCASGSCPAPSAACNDGPAGEYIKTVRDDAACDTLRAQLAATVTGNQVPEISHALLFSAKQDVGKPGSQALFVCSGYTWACSDPGSADEDGPSKVDYQIDFGMLETPGCGFTRSGYRCW